MAALLANAGIAIMKGIAAVITSSGAMLAETIHSVADSGNQALLLLGFSRAERPADKRHPFGYGSERYFWAFVVALVLFSLGSLFSLYEGIHKLLHPSPISSPVWAYAVLAGSLVLEGNALRLAARAVKKERGDESFYEWFLDSKQPALSLVFLEDAGAVFGLVAALVGVMCAHVFEIAWADGLATVLIGLLLGGIALVMFVRCHRLLVGESVRPEDEELMRAALAEVAVIQELVELRTLHIGPETVLVVIEARFDGSADAVRAIESAVRAVFPPARYIAIEPA